MLHFPYEKFGTDTTESAPSPFGRSGARAFRVTDSVFPYTGSDAKRMERYQSSELEPINQGSLSIETGDGKASSGRICFVGIDFGRAPARAIVSGKRFRDCSTRTMGRTMANRAL